MAKKFLSVVTVLMAIMAMMGGTAVFANQIEDDSCPKPTDIKVMGDASLNQWAGPIIRGSAFGGGAGGPAPVAPLTKVVPTGARSWMCCYGSWPCPGNGNPMMQLREHLKTHPTAGPEGNPGFLSYIDLSR